MDENEYKIFKDILDCIKVEADMFKEISNDFDYISKDFYKLYNKISNPIECLRPDVDIEKYLNESTSTLTIKLMMIQNKIDALSIYKSNLFKNEEEE